MGPYQEKTARGERVESEFEKYRIVQDRLFDSDFDKELKSIEKKVLLKEDSHNVKSKEKEDKK